MPGRYYTCPVKKYSIDDDGYQSEFYAGKIYEYRDDYNYVVEIPSKVNGTPKEGWTVCHITGSDFTTLDNDPDFVHIIDNPISDEEIDVPGRAIAEANKRGIRLNPRMRKNKVVRLFGQKLNPHFNEQSFGVLY